MNRLLKSIVVTLCLATLTTGVSMFYLGVTKTAETVEQGPAKFIGAAAVISAPTTARVGELVRLDATGSDAVNFKWLVVPETTDFEVYAEGKRAVFSARGQGEFLFVLGAAKDDGVDLITHRLRVIGPPTPPAEGSSISDFVVFWLWELQVSPESKVKLADNFERISKMNLPEARDWVYETQKSNRDVLGVEITAWEPFLKNLGGLLGSLAEKNMLTTPEEHAKVWAEIAAALRKG